MNYVYIQENSMPQAYHQMITALYAADTVTPEPEEGRVYKEIGLTAVINYPFDEPMISKYFLGGTYELERYKEKIADGAFDFNSKNEAGGYTIHGRMVDQSSVDNEGKVTHVNQLDYIMNELKQNKYSRRAIVTVRQIADDMFNQNSSALNTIQFLIRNDKLDMFINFRSADVIGVYPDLFAYAHLQKSIAEKLNYPVGKMIYTCNCLHYKGNYEDIMSYWNYKITSDYDKPYHMCRRYEGNWKNKMEKAAVKIAREIEEMKGGK